MDLKFTAKSLQRQARKCEKEEKADKLKVKKAIEKGNMDGARIYAENAIRKRTEQMNYLRLASRLDAVVARLDTQAKMTTINKSMASIVKSLESSLAAGKFPFSWIYCSNLGYNSFPCPLGLSYTFWSAKSWWFHNLLADRPYSKPHNYSINRYNTRVWSVNYALHSVIRTILIIPVDQWYPKSYP